MKLNPLVCALTVAVLFLPPASAAPPRPHKQGAVKPPRRSPTVRRVKPTGRAFILRGTFPGGDPNRMDPMAHGRGMHPERLDRMNAVPPARPAPVTPK